MWQLKYYHTSWPKKSITTLKKKYHSLAHKLVTKKKEDKIIIQSILYIVSFMHRAPQIHSLSSQRYRTCEQGGGERNPLAERSNAPTTSGGIVKGQDHSDTAPILMERVSFQASHMMSRFHSSVHGPTPFSCCCCCCLHRHLH